LYIIFNFLAQSKTKSKKHNFLIQNIAPNLYQEKKIYNITLRTRKVKLFNIMSYLTSEQ